MKLFHPKTNYTPLAIKVFNDLNALSDLPPHPSSSKSKLLKLPSSYFTHPEEIMDRFG